MNDGPIDRSVFADLQESTGSEFVAELVTTFLDEAPDMLADLKIAVATGAQDQFRRSAHSIKSNANIFGAHELAELARQMEVAGLGPDQAAHEIQIAVLDAEFENTAAALRELRDG